jgi:BirA family biotin operon repressor/biotin-[acetyl-CoA-carboxylase] ligase
LRPQEATQLTVATATALVRAIRSVTDLKPEIKWPNDILIGGKKVAGVLTELSAELDHVKYIILGIGVNVNLGAGEFPSELRKLATSLKIEAGRPISRPELAAAILRELDEDYARIGAGLFGTVADEWEASCSTLGREVVIRTGDHQIRGRAESLGEDGSLVLRTDHGRLERVTGGDVTLEK